MEDQFYVRIRGRVQGPYDTAKLQSLVRRGQLSRMHEVSTDRSLWRQAADFPELFATPTVAPSGTAHVQQQTSAHDGELELEPSTSSAAEWFYALNSEQKGPVSFEQLKALLQAGVISGGSLVWREGMSEWTPAEVVPTLRRIGFSGRGNEEAKTALDQNSLRTLKETIPWVNFLVVCIIASCCLSIVGGVLLVLLGVRERETEVTAKGITLILQSIAGIWAGLLLNSYASNIRKYVNKPSAEVLEASFGSLRSLWMYLSILTIIVLVVVVSLLIYAFAMGMSL